MKRKNISSMGDPTAGTFSTNISDVSLIESNYRVPYERGR